MAEGSDEQGEHLQVRQLALGGKGERARWGRAGTPSSASRTFSGALHLRCFILVTEGVPGLEAHSAQEQNRGHCKRHFSAGEAQVPSQSVPAATVAASPWPVCVCVCNDQNPLSGTFALCYEQLCPTGTTGDVNTEQSNRNKTGSENRALESCTPYPRPVPGWLKVPSLCTLSVTVPPC